jgi:hypothetical protein
MELGVGQFVSEQVKIIMTMFRTITGSDNYFVVKAVQLTLYTYLNSRSARITPISMLLAEI